jgi:hypothetical protein
MKKVLKLIVLGLGLLVFLSSCPRPTPTNLLPTNQVGQ